MNSVYQSRGYGLNSLRSKLLVAAGFTGLVLAMPAPSFAQTTGDNTISGIESVTVTARKRSEDILDTPISITALSGDELAEHNINSLGDLANEVPGVSFGSTAGGGASNLVFRGVAPANKIAGLNVDANVGIFVDGIYQTSRNSVVDDLDLIDVGDLQVVKGPQSALYGRSTFAGALAIDTAAPSRTAGVTVTATAGNAQDYRLKVSDSGAIIDNVLYGRITGAYSSFDGTIFNPAQPNNNLGGYDKKALSGSLEWHPMDHLTATLSGFMTSSQEEQAGVSLLSYTANNCGASNTATAANLLYCGTMPVPQVGGYAPPNANNPGSTAQTNSGISPGLPPNRNINKQLALNVKYDFQDFSVVSITGVNTGENFTISDYDGTAAGDVYGVCSTTAPGSFCSSNPNAFSTVAGSPYQIYAANQATYLNTPANLRYVNANAALTDLGKTKTFSEEVRIQSKDGERLRWMAGLYYYDAAISDLGKSGVSVTSGGRLATTDLLVQVENAAGQNALASLANLETVSDVNDYGALVTNAVSTQSNKTYSLFGSVGYDITHDLKLDLEGRLNREVKTDNETVYFFFPSIGYEHKTYDSFTPRAILQYQAADNAMIYASIAKGVHSGGFNRVSIATNPNGFSYGEEKNWTYELGTKGKYFGNTLVVSADLYYTAWTNVQNQVLVSNGPALPATGAIGNSGGMSVKGAELSLDWQPLDWLLLGANGIITDAHFSNGSYDTSRAPFCGTAPQTNAGVGNAAPGTNVCNFILVPAVGPTPAGYQPSIAGNTPANSPDNQFNLHAVVSGSLSNYVADGWNWSGRVDVNHTGKEYVDDLNLTSYGQRTLVDLRATVENDKYSLSVWGTNVANKRYISYVIAQALTSYNFSQNPYARFIGDGARYGVTLSAKF